MTLIITNGLRPRKIAECEKTLVMPKDENGDTIPFDNQEELETYWSEQSKNRLKYAQEYGVSKSPNDRGIFTQNILEQMQKFNVGTEFIFVSQGLGVVLPNLKYTQFSLPKENFLKSLTIQKKDFDIRSWWVMLTQGKQQLHEHINAAIAQEKRVILAINSMTYNMVRDDIFKIDRSLNYKKYLRIVGGDLENTISIDFLDCLMPWDQELLYERVKTRKSNGIRKMAFLLEHSCTDKNSTAADDYKLLTQQLNNKNLTLSYDAVDVRATNKKLLVIKGIEARKLIEDNYYERCHGLSMRIKRIAKKDGYFLKIDEIDEAIKQIKIKNHTDTINNNGTDNNTIDDYNSYTTSNVN